MLNEKKQMGQSTKPRTNEKFVFDEQQRPQTKAVNTFFN